MVLKFKNTIEKQKHMKWCIAKNLNDRMKNEKKSNKSFVQLLN